MHDKDRIRERAYALWEREGRPHGRDEAHWDQARHEIEQAGVATPDAPDQADEPAPAGAAAPGDEAKRTRRKAATRVEAPVAESVAATKAAAKPRRPKRDA